MIIIIIIYTRRKSCVFAMFGTCKTVKTVTGRWSHVRLWMVLRTGKVRTSSCTRIIYYIYGNVPACNMVRRKVGLNSIITAYYYSFIVFQSSLFYFD